MWFIVVLQVWKHWDSKHSKVMTVSIWDVDKHRALRLATDAAFEQGWGAVSWSEVIEITSQGPRTVLSD